MTFRHCPHCELCFTNGSELADRIATAHHTRRDVTALAELPLPVAAVYAR